MSGRGAWTKTGMPANGSPFYEYIVPENVGWAGAQPNADQSHRAVNYGVKALQKRVNELGFGTATNPPLATDGILDLRTALGIGALQRQVGTVVDGQAGPKTMVRALWPVIRDAHGAGLWTAQIKQIVGGICQHESGWDPGAVGFEDPDDLGLVQINGPANPTMSEADRFDYRKAFTYALNRVLAAITTPGYTTDAAIASYGYPAVAAQWVKSGQELYPQNPDLNDKALAYVAFIKAWQPPSG